MRCTGCSKEFSVGSSGSSAPGVFLIITLAFCSIACLLFLMDVADWPWACLLVAGFVLVQVGVTWGDCRSRGGTCPRCGVEHRVRPWSL